MRLPRQDTPLSLPAEQPWQGIARDEALLERMEPGALPLVRWWVAASRAVVVGLGLRYRLASVVDVARCEADGVVVLERRAGGGALLLDDQMLCGAVCVPTTSVSGDVTESYRWLGDDLAARLRSIGLGLARRVEVDEARADVAAIRARPDPLARILGSTCYGVLSPHEVAIGHKKVVGLAQVRRRHAALFVFGVLLRDQSALADYLQVPDEPTRERVRRELKERTLGIGELTSRSASEVAAAIVGATPCEP
jgi:lipoate-protein ligase A